MDADSQRIRDEWIALRCQTGEPEAFRDLVHEMERPLRYFAARLLHDDNEALDVLQLVWLQAFRSIRRLSEPRSVRAWLYRLTRGIAIDRLRKAAAVERIERDYAADTAEIGEEPSFDQDDVAALHQALNRLPLLHREVLVLHFLEVLSVAEVASVLDCPPGTVKSRLYHAKRALKAALLGGHDGI